MDVDEVAAVLQEADRRRRLALEVGVHIAGRAGTSTLLSPAQMPIPLMRSTAEMTPPFTPNRSSKEESAGRVPSPQNQQQLAGRRPRETRARLTGWSRSSA